MEERMERIKKIIEGLRQAQGELHEIWCDYTVDFNRNDNAMNDVGRAKSDVEEARRTLEQIVEQGETE